MYNKKVLSTAKKELNKAKAPKKPKDMITDRMGQWKYPGLDTRIPGDGSKDINITMDGVYKPLLAIADTGEKKKLYPGDNHTFRGAKYVDEFPEAKRGGNKKRKTKSLSGTNKLMQKNPLLRDYKNREFDPNVDYFQKGGMKTVKSKDGTVTNTFINAKGDKVIQVKTKDGKYHEKVIPRNQHFDTLGKLQSAINGPLVNRSEPTLEERVDYNLGHPQRKASNMGRHHAEKGEDPIDNIRHPFAGRYTAEALYKMRKKDTPWAPDWMNKGAAWLDANMLGIGHEAGTIFRDERPWSIKAREAAEDIYNNGVGINTGLSDKTSRQKTDYLLNKAYNFELPDGRGEEHPFRNKWVDPYDKKEDGGSINLELTEDEIDQYVKGGYIVEDISVPELNQAQKGIIQISDPEEFAYRNQKYKDSLDLYNYSNKQVADKTKRFGSDAIGVQKEYNKKKAAEFLKEQLKTYGDLANGEGDKYGKLITKLVKKSNISPIGLSINVEDHDYIFKKPTQKVVLKTENKPVQDNIIQKPVVQQEVKPIIQQNIKPVQKTNYPEGYQPYSLYGKVLDPERYGYGESNEGKPIQVGQYMDAFAKELQMEKYKKANKYPWVKQEGGLIEAQNGIFIAPPLPRDRTRSETTQMVSLPARQAIQHIKNKPGADKAKKKEKKEIQKFKKQLWKEYEKLPLSEKVSDRVGAFFVDPAGMTARALTGDQAYLPGMGKGLLNHENPEIRDKYLKELGYTKGEFDASDLQNMVNPFYWASSLVDNTEKGNYGTAALEALFMGLPKMPKGSFSPSTWKQGANMIREDLSKGLSRSKPKPTRVTNIGLDTYSGDSFTPIRIGGKKYKHAGQEWYNIDAGDYPGMTWEETQKQGLQDAGESLNQLFKKNPNYGKETFDVGDFNFKQFSEGDNALKDLYAKLSKQKQLNADDFYTDQEVLELANKYKKHLENLESFDKNNPLDPAEMIFGALTGQGNARDELFNTLYPNSFQPSFREKFLTPAQEQLLKHYNFRTGDKGSLEKNSLKNFGDMFFKPQQNIELPSVKNLKEFDNPDHFFYEDPKVVVSEMRGTLGLSLDDIEKLSSEELLNYRNEVINKLKKQAVDRVNENLKNKFTGPKAWQELIKNPGYYNKLGGLIQAQKGKTVKSKDGTVTNTITKPNGDVVIQVKTKDGKYYEKVKHGLPQFVKDEFKKRADWENRSSGMAQPVDDFWTLPIGMTSAGVKGAVGLVKGLTSLGRTAAKSSLGQATKAGTKAFFNTSIKNLPGANLKNLINATFAGVGLNEYLDKDSDLRKVTKKAINNPTVDNIGEATGENVLNLMNFAGLGLPNKFVKGAQAVKGRLPKYKNYYRVEPTTFSKDPTDQLSGRWIGELEDMPFYVTNLKNPNLNVRILRKKMKVSDWEKISGKNMSDEAKLMSIGTGEYDKYTDAATAGLIPENIAKRISKGVPLTSDIEFLSNNKYLYNKREGILSDTDVNKLRTKKKVLPFSSWDRIEFSGDDKKSAAMRHLFSASDKKNKLNKNILGIPREYLPFKDGGIISNLTQKEIDEYIAKGYIVEDVD